MLKTKSRKPLSTAALVCNLVNTRPAPKFQSITSNADVSKVTVRTEVLEGVTYKVVPMVMVVEGVLNGSGGPLYYPSEELSKFPSAWDTKPVVVNHPVKNGTSVSACSPEVIQEYKIGMIMNTKWSEKKKKLKAEAWINPVRANEVDPRIMVSINKLKTLELSTGLFTENEETEGEFNGEAYEAIARNYRPDHLAVLPDSVGACSVADGAGFVRNQLQQNELSFDKTRSLLSEALKVKFKDLGKTDGSYTWVPIYIEDVFENFVIYSDGSLTPYKLFQLGYSKTETEVTLVGEPKEVVRVTEYRSPEGTLIGNSKETIKPQVAMTKKQIVNELIGNHGWSKSDRSFLEAKSEEFLTNLLQSSKTKVQANKSKKPAAAKAADEDAEEGVTDNEEDSDDSEDSSEDAVAANADGYEDDEEEGSAAPAKKKKKKDEEEAMTKNKAKPKVMTAEEYIANAPAGIREVLANGQAQLTAKRKALVSTILGNAKNKMTKEELRALPVSTLESIAALAAPTANRASEDDSDDEGASFEGQADGDEVTDNEDASDDEPLGLPTSNWDATKSKKKSDEDSE
jgi:hypothetical protein